jgi:hypothetical protein
MDAWGFSPVLKLPGREADHSSPTSAEVKKMWIYTSTPSIRLHGVVKQWDKFTFFVNVSAVYKVQTEDMAQVVMLLACIGDTDYSK